MLARAAAAESLDCGFFRVIITRGRPPFVEVEADAPPSFDDAAPLPVPLLAPLPPVLPVLPGLETDGAREMGLGCVGGRCSAGAGGDFESPSDGGEAVAARDGAGSARVIGCVGFGGGFSVLALYHTRRAHEAYSQSVGSEMVKVCRSDER